MPWLESVVVIALGATAIVLAFKYSQAIATMAGACLEALGAPISVLLAWKHRRDSESRIGHSSK
jgi:hypothetical protein